MNTTGQVGGAVGLAVLATVSTGRTAALRADGMTTVAALTGGYHLALWVAAALMTAAVVVCMAVVRASRPQPAAAAEPTGARTLTAEAAR